MRTLVSKAQRGDSEAFIKLFSTYEKELYRIAFLNVKNEADIERMARLAKSVGEKHPYFEILLSIFI